MNSKKLLTCAVGFTVLVGGSTTAATSVLAKESITSTTKKSYNHSDLKAVRKPVKLSVLKNLGLGNKEEWGTYYLKTGGITLGFHNYSVKNGLIVDGTTKVDLTLPSIKVENGKFIEKGVSNYYSGILYLGMKAVKQYTYKLVILDGLVMSIDKEGYTVTQPSNHVLSKYSISLEEEKPAYVIAFKAKNLKDSGNKSKYYTYTGKDAFVGDKPVVFKKGYIYQANESAKDLDYLTTPTKDTKVQNISVQGGLLNYKNVPYSGLITITKKSQNSTISSYLVKEGVLLNYTYKASKLIK